MPKSNTRIINLLIFPAKLYNNGVNCAAVAKYFPNFEFTWFKMGKMLILYQKSNYLRFVCAFLSVYASLPSALWPPTSHILHFFAAIKRLLPQKFSSREHNFVFVLARELLNIKLYEPGLYVKNSRWPPYKLTNLQ